ncbi:LysR family transcriptional regulator [Janthinobacterium sp. BJB1]|uniref:LysR substrate-binding domain-containing protein n=1 Tax=Janthinobacterium sp. GW458P TaxID=1981504 RepID=UPI000A324211|nr:LysR family transcriptional regulator [Janthinobacterium sp. GW458P]MBE3025747.1 LysR family transcriptional regulator [Janthinobacterium sp. GW458P]PHV13637.1 LysR family transcriptional regulator [Janthinobacterium sp. BJB303]PJD00208.1 LysR family transcriptional regulator [Janthinobacterium sp. BJB1]
MDKIKAMQTFVRIVEANSFSKAAETLNLPRAALTATLQKLEAYLGTQLLQRTTRRLSLTPEGAEYFRHCIAILKAVETAELAFRGPEAKKPRGLLRVNLPNTVGRTLVVPQLAQFHAACPDVQLQLSLTDRLVDLTQEGIDCALRVGDLQDSAFIGKQVGLMRFVTCAAPAYLARHGTPRTLADLAAHQGIMHYSGRTGRAFDWDFLQGSDVRRVPMAGPIAVNDADASVDCALQGLGLAQAALYQVRSHLDSGALVAVLSDCPPTPMPMSLLTPQGRLAAPKVQAFAGWLAGLLAKNADVQMPGRA